MQVQVMPQGGMPATAGIGSRNKEAQLGDTTGFAALLMLLQAGQNGAMPPLTGTPQFGAAASVEQLLSEGRGHSGIAFPATIGAASTVEPLLAQAGLTAVPVGQAGDEVATPSFAAQDSSTLAPTLAPVLSAPAPEQQGVSSADDVAVTPPLPQAAAVPAATTSGMTSDASFTDAGSEPAPPVHTAPGSAPVPELFARFSNADEAQAGRPAARLEPEQRLAAHHELPPFVEATGAERLTVNAAVDGTDAADAVPPAPWTQVVRHLERHGRHELRPGGPSIELQLHPAELGKVQVRLTLQAGQLAAELQVATAAAKQALEAGMAELRSTLQAQGFDVQSLSVDVHDGGQRPDYGQTAWDSPARGDGHGHGGHEHARGQSRESQWIAAAPSPGGASLLDIRA